MFLSIFKGTSVRWGRIVSSRAEVPRGGKLIFRFHCVEEAAHQRASCIKITNC